MSSAAGIVGRVNPRNTKVGITYSFTLDGQDNWYGTFKDTPPAEGEYVEFDYTTNGAGFHNVDMKTLVRKENTAEAAPAVKVAHAVASNRDANIQWQSARNAAISLSAAALDAGVLDLGSKKDGKLEALLINVNQLTVDFFTQSMEVSATGEVPEDFQG